MKRFRRILVAADLSRDDELVSDELVPPSEEAVEQAIWLAGHSGADLLLLFSLDVSERARQLIAEDDDSSSNVLGHARQVLNGLVDRAKKAGVSADFRVVFGKGWLEILRQVQIGHHDLVIAGTRHQSRMRSSLLGSTGMKLLRKCPCPVWITQPRPHRDIDTVVAATDFSPTCDFALDLAASLAQLHDGELHIVHAMSSADEMVMRRANLSEAEISAHRTQFEQDTREQIGRLLARDSVQELRREPIVHLEVGDADHVILETIQSLPVDLLAMGTLARTGISGVLMGNTAERLLPRINCSLLAVKPKGFVCPLTFHD